MKDFFVVPPRNDEFLLGSVIDDESEMTSPNKKGLPAFSGNPF